ncbi:MAG: photosynthetic complex assembly protein PuhC [Myxococcaceae bacterium]|nr:photosynthetic complex assembly protein PuhC [Myxococcaceae bacterium]
MAAYHHVSHHHDQKIPRPVLIGAATLMALSLLFAGLSRQSLKAELAKPRPAPVESVTLSFEDRAGAVVVFDASSGRELVSLAPNSNGFVRGVLRGFFRERKLESLGRDASFVLAREVDGRLSLEDKQTGRRVDLNAFGPDNTAAFAQLLDAGRRAQR